MSYQINITKSVQKELIALESDIYSKVIEVLRNLSSQPRPHGSLKLKDRDGWRIRIGDYRIIYEIEDKTKQINILHIGNRKDIYKK